jgi:hypothetical protein
MKKVNIQKRLGLSFFNFFIFSFPFKSDYPSALRYIEHQFLSSRAFTTDNLIYIHHTCATDTNNVSAVFSACSDAILNQQMCAIGMA